jgi:hypothetical protein
MSTRATNTVRTTLAAAQAYAHRLDMRAFRSILVALLLVLTVPAPAMAEPPERTEDPWMNVSLDVEHQLVAFWNITRADYCAWAESGFTGAPPVDRLVPSQYIETADGAVVAKFSATSTLELWALDADADFSAPCADTDGSSAPWAVGSAHLTGNDNDLFVSGSRTNSFGGRSRGTVWDASGAGWRYHWTFRALTDRDFESRAVVDRSTLTRGH